MSTGVLAKIRLPNFTVAQLEELTTLGLREIQVEELRKAVRDISLRLLDPARLNDVKSLLSEVLAASDKLIRLMECMAPSIDAAHAKAGNTIELTYWMLEEPGDWDVSFADQLKPRLLSLSQAAQNGLGLLPKKPTRKKAGWRPIQDIEDALLLGWLKMKGGAKADGFESLAEMYAYADDDLLALPIPPELRPSASPDCVFRRIVGICYAAAGGNPDPERALKAFMKQKISEGKEFTAMFERVADQLRAGSGRNV